MSKFAQKMELSGSKLCMALALPLFKSLVLDFNNFAQQENSSFDM